MPIIEVWGLPEHGSYPEKEDRKSLPKLVADLQKELAGIKELGLAPEQFTVFFPPDRAISSAVGEGRRPAKPEVIIWIRGLFRKPERTRAVRTRLAKTAGSFIKRRVPEAALVECFVESFNPTVGFWSSAG